MYTGPRFVREERQIASALLSIYLESTKEPFEPARARLSTQQRSLVLSFTRLAFTNWQSFIVFIRGTVDVDAGMWMLCCQIYLSTLLAVVMLTGTPYIAICVIGSAGSMNHANRLCYAYGILIVRLLAISRSWTKSLCIGAMSGFRLANFPLCWWLDNWRR